MENNNPSQRHAQFCMVDGRDPIWQIGDVMIANLAFIPRAI
jgi:hypothetical protein